MAFLSFSSSKLSKDEGLVVSHHHRRSTTEGSWSGIFSVTRKQGLMDHSNTQKKHHRPSLSMPPALARGETFELSENDFEVEEVATVESSPTPTPRPTTSPSELLSLPDLPKLAFPSSPIRRNSNNARASAAPRLLPRPLPNVRRANPELRYCQEENISNLRTTTQCGFEQDTRDVPPVEFIAFPVRNTQENLLLPPPLSPVLKARGCLSGPPPRAGAWDDATIESYPEEDTAEEGTTQHQASESTLRDNEGAHTAEALAKMKPWIDRAARLALLQNRAHQQQERHRRRLLARKAGNASEHPNPRALLASLEQPSLSHPAPVRVMPPARVSTSTSSSSSSSEEDLRERQPPRIVKWHVVQR